MAVQPVDDVPSISSPAISNTSARRGATRPATSSAGRSPCYLLGEGYVSSFKELIEDTEWEKYGTGNYEKCANCMVHCGYEPTAVNDTIKHPLRALQVFMRGVKTDGPMAPEIALDKQRPAEYVFSRHVEDFLDKAHAEEAEQKADRSHAA